MLIDKKREEMYYNCRMRKKKLDYKFAVVRAVLIIPPLLIFAGTVLDIVMSMIGDAAVLATGVGLYGVYDSNGPSILSLLDLIITAAMTLFAVCLTIFRTEYALKKAVPIYIFAAFACLVLLFVLDYIPMSIYFILSAIGIPAAIFNKKLIEEDNRMSMLDGYPHFNPLLIKHTDTPFVPPTQEELDGMSADERIMYEREH